MTRQGPRFFPWEAENEIVLAVSILSATRTQSFTKYLLIRPKRCGSHFFYIYNCVSQNLPSSDPCLVLWRQLYGLYIIDQENIEMLYSVQKFGGWPPALYGQVLLYRSDSKVYYPPIQGLHLNQCTRDLPESADHFSNLTIRHQSIWWPCFTDFIYLIRAVREWLGAETRGIVTKNYFLVHMNYWNVFIKNPHHDGGQWIWYVFFEGIICHVNYGNEQTPRSGPNRWKCSDKVNR